ncbi:MAG: putative polysaccharide biosynthesis protein [Sarcina sp.]
MKEQSLTKSFAILSIAGILGKLMSVLYVPVLKSILGPEGIGIYFKVYDVFVFIYAITNVGMQTAISKHVAELSAVGNLKDAIRSFKLSRTMLIVIGGVFTAIMFFGANAIATITKNPRTVYGLMALAPAIITTCILATYKGYFQGKNQMKPVAIASLLEQFANVIVSIFFASILIKFGPEIGTVGGTIGTSVGAIIAIGYLIYVYYLFKPEKEAEKMQCDNVKRVKSKKIVKTLIAYGLPITLSAGLQNFGNLIDMFNVSSRLLVAGFTEQQGDMLYGLLGQWRTLINVPMIFITSLCVAILPVLSKANVLKDKISMKKNIKFSFRVTYLIGIPAAVGLAVLAKEVYTYMYGEPTGYQMMILGSAVLVFMAIVFVQNIVLQSIDHFYFVVTALIIGLIVKFGANYVLVANLDINIYGAVIAFYLYYIVVILLNNIKIKQVTRIKISHIKLMIKPLIAAMYMGGGIFLAKKIISIIIDTNKFGSITGIGYTGILVVIGVAMYGHALIFLKAIKAEDIKSLSPRIYNKIPQKIKNKLQ